MIWSEAKNLRTAPQAFLMVWWPTYPSPADWLTGLFRTEDPPQYNLSHYSNPDFDRLVAEGTALEAVERDQAIDRYRRAQSILVEDAVAIFVGDFDDRVIHRSDLEGVTINPAYRTVMFYPLRRASAASSPQRSAPAASGQP
jgi:peptide/nickel transport system substrate-binding protein